MTRRAIGVSGIMIGAALVIVGIIIIVIRHNLAGPPPTPSADKLIGPSPRILGNPNAQVTLVEFGDYQCLACLEARSAVQQIIKGYGDRVRFIFRNYSLKQNPNAQVAALVAEEAGAQGKFWEMHDKLFEHQKDWESDTGDKALRLFYSYSNDLSIDANKVKAAVEGKVYAKRIVQDQVDGRALAISATPAFFVNGKLLPGVPDYQALRAAIEAALKS